MDPGEKSLAEALPELRSRGLRGRDVIIAWLERMGVPLRDRDDLAQDVLLGAVTSWPRYDPVAFTRSAPNAARRRCPKPASAQPDEGQQRRGERAMLQRWMHGITRNVVSRYREKTGCGEELRPDPLAEDTPDEGALLPDADLEQRATRAELSAAVFLLPPLSRLAAMSAIKELALRTGQPLSTLYKVRARAYAALAGLLKADPVGQWRAQAVALERARRVLCSHGLPDREARALLWLAAHQPAVEEADVWRRAVELGLAGSAAGPLALAALAAREATDPDDGRCARDLVQLAVDATALGLAQLRRAYGGCPPAA